MNTKNDHSFARSARVPDTMEAAEAMNTIWNSQSDIVACPACMTAPAADGSPPVRARSARVGPWSRSSEPNQPPSSTPVNMMLWPTR